MSWSRLITYRFIATVNRFKNCQPILYRSSFKNQVASFHRHVVSLNKNGAKQKINEESDSDSDENHQKEKDLINVKLQILNAALNFVPEHGWSKKSIALGAQSLGLSMASHGLIEEGGADLVHYFNFICNENLCVYLKENKELKKMNTQEFVTNALEKRLRMVIPFVSRWPEAMALTVSPMQLSAELKNLLELVDIIWSYSGSKSLDTTWYSKRISLAVTYKTCELSLVQDKSPDFSDSMEFLQRRIELVMSADQFMEQVSASSKDIPKLGFGALITVQNILGLNNRNR